MNQPLQRSSNAQHRPDSGQNVTVKEFYPRLFIGAFQLFPPVLSCIQEYVPNTDHLELIPLPRRSKGQECYGFSPFFFKTSWVPFLCHYPSAIEWFTGKILKTTGSNHWWEMSLILFAGWFWDPSWHPQAFCVSLDAVQLDRVPQSAILETASSTLPASFPTGNLN